MKLSNLKIGTRLYASFAVVIAMLALAVPEEEWATF